jgi:hypothetical protein
MKTMALFALLLILQLATAVQNSDDTILKELNAKMDAVLGIAHLNQHHFYDIRHLMTNEVMKEEPNTLILNYCFEMVNMGSINIEHHRSEALKNMTKGQRREIWDKISQYLLNEKVNWNPAAPLVRQFFKKLLGLEKLSDLFAHQFDGQFGGHPYTNYRFEHVDVNDSCETIFDDSNGWCEEKYGHIYIEFWVRGKLRPFNSTSNK